VVTYPPSPQHPSFPITKGLVSYWPMGIQTTRDNIMQDVWGNNHGIINGATVTEEGYSFDGNDYVQVQDSASLDTDYITVVGWFYPLDSTPGILVNKATSGSLRFSLQWSVVQTNKFRVWMANATAPTLNRVVYSSVYSPNMWYFVGATFDGNQIKLYINGSFEDSIGLDGVLAKNDAPLLFGTWYDLASNFFSGIIGPTLLYKRPLSSSEIQTLYNLGRGITHKGYPRSPTYP